ncbi:hypothetical protein [Paraburkholderia sp. RL17-337-BIB-A]|uniref:hypothetical protein n=1 Tax=Paraburkholderia sp. RL17-337-BIB-A TaxID=3031636 RepID=UPI0038BCA9D6
MLKLIFGTIILSILPIFAFSETLSTAYQHAGHAIELSAKEASRQGVVEFYESDKLIGKYSNLIINETSLSSTVVSLAGGSLALAIDSNGSRNKFHIIAPIRETAQKLYVNCIYKTAYDAVDEVRSVGMSCKKTELRKFDVSGAINDDGMISYSDKPTWLKTISPSTCANAVGLDFGIYRAARCSDNGVSDSKDQKITIFDKNGNVVFSISGYEFIPLPNGTNFSLMADLQTESIIFDGDLLCLSKKNPPVLTIDGTAKMANRFAISYAIGVFNGCLAGHYSYAGKNGKIILNGYKDAGLFHLLEIGNGHVSTGLFILNHLDQTAHGVWVGTPPKEVLNVN